MDKGTKRSLIEGFIAFLNGSKFTDDAKTLEEALQSTSLDLEQQLPPEYAGFFQDIQLYQRIYSSSAGSNMTSMMGQSLYLKTRGGSSAYDAIVLDCLRSSAKEMFSLLKGSDHSNCSATFCSICSGRETITALPQASDFLRAHGYTI
jgi:hypothetical protein